MDPEEPKLPAELGSNFHDDEMAAQKAWGIRPQEWRMMPVDDRADIMVHEYMDGIRSLYRHHQLKDSKEPKKKPEGGMAAFKAMGERFRRPGASARAP